MVNTPNDLNWSQIETNEVLRAARRKDQKPGSYNRKCEARHMP